jgi:hypothetical protein
MDRAEQRMDEQRNKSVRLTAWVVGGIAFAIYALFLASAMFGGGA